MNENEILEQIKKHNADYSEGFIGALSWMTKQIEEMLFSPSEAGISFANTPNIVRTKLTKFHQEKKLLLDSIQADQKAKNQNCQTWNEKNSPGN